MTNSERRNGSSPDQICRRLVSTRKRKVDIYISPSGARPQRAAYRASLEILRSNESGDSLSLGAIKTSRPDIWPDMHRTIMQMVDDVAPFSTYYRPNSIYAYLKFKYFELLAITPKLENMPKSGDVTHEGDSVRCEMGPPLISHASTSQKPTEGVDPRRLISKRSYFTPTATPLGP